ncbi:uncharacterized protein LOC121236635 [Juglans microcarpa x Juglans regia]|uniref:uncharacterized protein LOC121236635 n=1 Tax=Juglans microcarpa x Juglans regia TaxID=2249226 RepID=UPI001B7DB84A|nr:uncharacterized protein LOC121236635 [Juglans microcarpa x Juglans regia]
MREEASKRGLGFQFDWTSLTIQKDDQQAAKEDDYRRLVAAIAPTIRRTAAGGNQDHHGRIRRRGRDLIQSEGAYQASKILRVYSAEYRPAKYRRSKLTPAISFGEEDEEGVLYLHYDALVVTILVANFTTRRILVDNGSFAYILFWKALTLMGIDAIRLQPAPMPLKGFSKDMVQQIETITLSVLAGSAPCMASVMVNLLVLKAPSSYNVIIGKSTLNNLRVVTSTYHLKMKFPTSRGVGEI